MKIEETNNKIELNIDRENKEIKAIDNKIKKLQIILNPNLHLGLSCYMQVDSSQKKCIIDLTIRSTWNYDGFCFREDPRLCFFFHTFPIQTECGLLTVLKEPCDSKKIKELGNYKSVYILYGNNLYYADEKIKKLISKEISSDLKLKFPPPGVSESASIEVLQLIQSETGHQKKGFAFYRKGYTTEFVIGRGIAWKEAEYLRQKIELFLRESKIIPDDFTLIVLFLSNNYAKNYTELWNQVKNNPEKIARHLEKTIYIATGLDEKPPHEFWPDLTDAQIIKKAFRVAKKRNVTLQLDNCPDEYRYFNTRPLTLAIHMGKFEIVKCLVEEGACITGIHDDYVKDDFLAYTSLRITEAPLLNPSLQKIKSYLEICIGLLDAIKDNNYINFCFFLFKNDRLPPDIRVDINKPIHGLTPLALALDKKNADLEFVSKMIDKFKQYPSFDMDAMSKGNRTALTYARSTEAQELLCNNDASPEIAMQYFEEQKNMDNPLYKQLSLFLSLSHAKTTMDKDLSVCFISIKKLMSQLSSLFSPNQTQCLDSIFKLIKSFWDKTLEPDESEDMDTSEIFSYKERKMEELFKKVEVVIAELIQIENKESEVFSPGLFQEKTFKKLAPDIIQALEPLKQYNPDKEFAKDDSDKYSP